MSAGIYLIACRGSGKKYIGSSKDLHKRRIQHFSGLGRKDHKNRHLQNAWDKYGKDAFSFSTLLICAEKNLLIYEQICIDFYDSAKTGYNILPIAGRTAGHKPTPEAIAKMVAKKKGVPMSALARANHAEAMQSNEVRAKISNALKSATWPPKTPEHVESVRKALTGIKRTESQRKAQSERMKGAPQGKRSAEARERMKAAQKGRMPSTAQLAGLEAYRAERKAKLDAEKAIRKAELDKRKTEKGGYSLTEEQKRKVSERMKGVKLSDSHRASLSRAAKIRAARQRAEREAAKLLQPPKPKSEFAMEFVDGKWKQSEAFKRKLSVERKGKKFTEAHKEALRKAWIKRAERERLAKTGIAT